MAGRMTNFKSAAIATGNVINESAYDNVKAVSENLEGVSAVAANIDNIKIANDNIDAISAVGSNIDSVKTVSDNIDNIKTANDNIDTISTVSENISNVNAVGESIDNVNAICDNIDGINTVSESIDNVAVVGESIDNVDAVADNIAKGEDSEILNAEANALSAADSIKDFKSRYFQGLAEDPTEDLNGDALTDGDLYFNTTDKVFKAYSTENDAWEEPTTDSYTKARLDTVHILRADKYLAAQDLAGTEYTDGNLTKVQYNNSNDDEHEELEYTEGKLTKVSHYVVDGTLAGETKLTYDDDDHLTTVTYEEV